MFKKEFWEKAREPALVLLICSFVRVLAFLMKDLRAVTVGGMPFKELLVPLWTKPGLVLTVTIAQFVALLLCRVFVRLEKPGNNGFWLCYAPVALGEYVNLVLIMERDPLWVIYMPISGLLGMVWDTMYHLGI